MQKKLKRQNLQPNNKKISFIPTVHLHCGYILYYTIYKIYKRKDVFCMEYIKCDVAIIGGGASGLMSAVALAKANKNLKIVIIEHNNKTGKKLLATGNGRCNLTNKNMYPNAYYGTVQPYMEKILNKYNADYICNYFQEIGLMTYSDDQGRVYPISNNVASVLDVLRNYIISKGVQELCDTTVTDIKKSKNSYVLHCNNDTQIVAKNVILSCGGKASPKLSTDGAGYSLAQKLNIKTNNLLPSLVPVTCDNKFLSSLKGIRVKGDVALFADNKIIEKQSGEIQFTANALSGICVFQLSRLVNEFFTSKTVMDKPVNKIELVVDILPQYTLEECRSIIYNRINSLKSYNIENFFDGFLHKRVSSAILKECKITDISRKVATLNKKEISSLATTLKHWVFTPSKISSFENAQVTAGGVLANEINLKSMESKKHSNLYIIGELLDIDGICGGYNLHWAWVSGIICSENIINKLRVKNDKTK